MDVPLECPRLCGLCDRYEILKYVYGEENLAPNLSMITAERRLSSEPKSIYREIPTSPILIINTTTSMIILPRSSSIAIYPPYQMLFYIFIKYLFVA